MAITKRQMDALIAIYKLTKKVGRPPTLKDIHNAMGLSGKSLSPVVRHVERLEKNGYLERTGTTRDIKITKKGQHLLAEERTINTSININPELLYKLNKLDPEYGKMYEAAWEILETNLPRRLASAAHNMRDIGTDLGSKYYKQCKKNDKKKNKDSKKTESYSKIHDPLANDHLEKERSIYSELATLTNQLAIQAHTNTLMTEEELIEKFKQYEKILLTILLEQKEVLEQIDDILKKKPSTKLSNRLWELTSLNPSTHKYTYKNLPLAWAKYILKHKKECINFLYISSDLEYLTLRLLNTNPSIATLIAENAIKSPKDKQANTYFAAGIIQTIHQFPSDKQIPLTEIYIKLVQEDHEDFRCYPLANALKKESIAKNKLLTDIIFKAIVEHFKKMSDQKFRNSHDGSIIRGLVTQIYECQGFQDANKLILKSLDILAQKRYKDHSRINIFSVHGGPFQEHTPTETILNETIKFVDKKLESSDSTQEDFLQILNTKTHSTLLTRCKLHWLKKSPYSTEENVLKMLQNYCWARDSRKEWGELAKSWYPQFTQSAKTQLLSTILNPPKSSYNGKNEIKNRIIAEQIDWIKSEVPTKTIPTEVQDIIRNYDLTPEPSIKSWTGPESPISEMELQNLTTQDIIKYLLNYEQEGDGWFTHSARGLSKTLGNILSENPELLEELLTPKNLIQLKPVYISTILRNTELLLKKNPQIANKAIDALLTLHKNLNNLITNSLDEENESTEYMLRCISHLLESIFQVDAEISTKKCQELTYLINYLTNHTDPTEAEEKECLQNGHDYRMISLNTVRGVALSTSIQFWLYQKRNYGLQDLPTWLKERLKKIPKANSINDSSIFGQYLPWIYHGAPELTQKLWKEIKKNEENFLASWISYLYSSLGPTIFSFMLDTYKEKIIDYLTVISPSTEKKQQKIQDEANKTLAEHIGYAICLGYPGTDSIIKLITTTKNIKKSRLHRFYGNIISIIGRAFIHGERLKGKITDVKYVQGIITQILNTNGQKAKKQFGWCVSSDTFDPNWTLDNLKISLEETDGEIEGSRFVIEFLNEQAIQHPKKVLECLYLMVIGAPGKTWIIQGHKDIIRSILNQIQNSNNNNEIIELEQKIRNILLRRGYDDFR